jgi:hypothetical protein
MFGAQFLRLVGQARESFWRDPIKRAHDRCRSPHSPTRHTDRGRSGHRHDRPSTRMSRDLGDVARSGFTKFRHATLYRARPPFGITRPMPQTIAGSVAHSACSPGHDGQSDSADDMGVSALAEDSENPCLVATAPSSSIRAEDAVHRLFLPRQNEFGRAVGGEPDANWSPAGRH